MYILIFAKCNISNSLLNLAFIKITFENNVGRFSHFPRILEHA